MANPRDPAVIDEIGEITKAKIEPFVASEASLLEIIAELDNELVDVAIQPEAKVPKVSVTPGEWEHLWRPPQLKPERLLQVRRRRRLADDSPIIATFPGLAPIHDHNRRDSDHEIDDETYREQLARVRHRDEVGRLLMRYAAHYFTRIALFAVHKGLAIGWMARGQGVAVDDVQSLAVPLDAQSLFSDLLRGDEHYVGPIPVGGGNEQLAKVLGEPRPTAVLMLPIRLKERTVAFLMGDNPGERTMAVPVELISAAAKKAGAAFEVLIIRKKILS
jgi:hypothetical protein